MQDDRILLIKAPSGTQLVVQGAEDSDVQRPYDMLLNSANGPIAVFVINHPDDAPPHDAMYTSEATAALNAHTQEDAAMGVVDVRLPKRPDVMLPRDTRAIVSPPMPLRHNGNAIAPSPDLRDDDMLRRLEHTDEPSFFYAITDQEGPTDLYGGATGEHVLGTDMPWL